jgi:hypothetical protein
VDVTHLRVSATISIGGAEKLFGTKWNLYATGEAGEAVVLTSTASSATEGY